jgi:sortase A
MRTRARRLQLLLRIVETLLLAAGLAAMGWYATALISASREQAALSRDLDRLVSARRPAARTAASNRSRLWRIEVPRINLSAVAREGVDVRTLRGAVGHIPGTALPGQNGNAGFAAHRDTFFRPLRGVRKGDDVLVTTADGVYRYSVTSTRVVSPANVSVLDPTRDKTLTLVTCYPFDYVGSAPQRFIVRATLRR